MRELNGVVLVHGLPGAGKTTFADALAKTFKSTVRVNADDVRHTISRDLGFKESDREEHAWRMGHIARLTLNGRPGLTVVDFICPTSNTRWAFESVLEAAKIPVFYIWMNTFDTCRYEDTLALYQVPERKYVNMEVQRWERQEELDLIVYQAHVQVTQHLKAKNNV